MQNDKTYVQNDMEYKYFYDHIVFSQGEKMCPNCFTNSEHIKLTEGFPPPPAPICKVKVPSVKLRSEKSRGYTVCYRQNHQTGILDRAISVCSADDQFSRPEGRKQCLKKLEDDPGATYETTVLLGTRKDAFKLKKSEMAKFFDVVEVS